MHRLKSRRDAMPVQPPLVLRASFESWKESAKIGAVESAGPHSASQRRRSPCQKRCPVRALYGCPDSSRRCPERSHAAATPSRGRPSTPWPRTSATRRAPGSRACPRSKPRSSTRSTTNWTRSTPGARCRTRAGWPRRETTPLNRTNYPASKRRSTRTRSGCSRSTIKNIHHSTSGGTPRPPSSPSRGSSSRRSGRRRGRATPSGNIQLQTEDVKEPTETERQLYSGRVPQSRLRQFGDTTFGGPANHFSS